MGDLNVTCSPAIYELFYEKVITEIIEVSERKKKDKSQSTILLSLTQHPDLFGILATHQSLNIALDRGKGEKGENHRITAVTDGGPQLSLLSL